jgi:hypothetical protein
MAILGRVRRSFRFNTNQCKKGSKNIFTSKRNNDFQRNVDKQKIVKHNHAGCVNHAG